MSEPRTFPDWHQLYKEAELERLPWYYAPLDPDLERALARWQLTSGKVLDLGTGPGTQALSLAERGFDVTGSDLSGSAVEKAAAAAQTRGLPVRFLQDDILDSRLDDRFDIVFDRGCFHVFPPERRADYARTVHRLVAPGGWFFLKCFSAKQLGDQGPHRFSPDELRRIFEPHFEVLSIDDTVYQGTLDPLPQALFSALRPR